MKGTPKAIKVNVSCDTLTKDYIRQTKTYDYDGKIIYDIVYLQNIAPIRYEGEIIFNLIRI